MPKFNLNLGNTFAPEVLKNSVRIPQLDLGLERLQLSFERLLSWDAMIGEIADAKLSRLSWDEIAGVIDVTSGRRRLPANLRGLDSVPIPVLSDALSDPLPLYAVPRAATVKDLLACEDYAARCRLIGERRDAIVHDCSEVLQQITNPTHKNQVSSLNNAIRSMRQGHWEAGQALATTVMDTFVWTWIRTEGVNRKIFTNGDRSLSEIEDLSYETYLVMRPVFHAHKYYSPGSARATVPRAFNRHATLHSAGTRQYSQRNAVVALMMAASLAWYMRLHH